MAVNENKKMRQALDRVLAQQNFLVYQANDLAKAFGRLTVFEQKVLDYCFSCVKKDDKPDTMYTIPAIDLIHHLGLNTSGDSYARIAKAFKKLNEKTALYFHIIDPDGSEKIRMTSLFGFIDAYKDGKFTFAFNPFVTPYIFQLKKEWYSFPLWELSSVRGKYALILLKLWNAEGHGRWDSVKNEFPKAYISGSMEFWQEWFRGTDENGKPLKLLPSGTFRHNMLLPALKELDSRYPSVTFDLTPLKDGRKIVGYTLQIIPPEAQNSLE
ncbi:replication initiation protein [Ligilactobacillus saerimneri]|uniref:replication initiation protein n=1 Tax=Ligilactobacillus saerimneri TaxID=228229 RepID=UPI003F260773